MTPSMTGNCSLVLFPIKKRRFAVDSRLLRELAPPVRLHKFPHTSKAIVGVIVRRGQIIPVYDAGSLLVGKPSTMHRFYLIVQCDPEDPDDCAAIPVDGECELATASVETATEEEPYITGVAKIGEESIRILDLARLVAGPSPRTDASAYAEVRT